MGVRFNHLARVRHEARRCRSRHCYLRVTQVWPFCSVGSGYAPKSGRVFPALDDAEGRLAELQCIEVGVFEDEAQAEGHAR